MYSDKEYQAVWLGDLLPGEWDTIYQSGYYQPPFAHDSLEILRTNSEKARGGTGKSAVNWREFHTDPNWINQWKSNSALGMHLDGLQGGYEQLYVEFWIKFDPNWTSSNGSGSSKVFRVFSWDEVGSFWQAFQGGSQGPLVLWDYGFDSTYGARNIVSFRGGPHGENYKMTDSEVDDLPRYLNGLGDMSANFTSDLKNATYSGDATMEDKVNLSPMPDSGVVSHEQVWGKSDNWTKMGFFVKMNSAPGVKDGVFKQWINGQLMIETNKVEWVGQNAENKMVKWNAVGIGGNDYWVGAGKENADRYEEWYAVDDLVISTEVLPGNSNGIDSGTAPSPPTGVSVKP